MGGSTPAYIDFYCEVNNAHRVRLQSPAHSTYSGNVQFTLPPSNGTSGYVLQTNGSGVTSWAAPYSDASVNTHLNTSSASSNQVLSWNGSDYAWVAQSSGGGGGVDSAATTTLITSTVDSNYVANRVSTAAFTPKPKYARLGLTSSHSVNTSYTAVTTFNTRDVDTSTGNALTATLGDGKFIIPAGVSKIRLRASTFIKDVSGQVILQFWKNGSIVDGTSSLDIDTAGTDTPFGVSAILDVVQNDYFQVAVWAADALSLIHI